LTEPFYDSHDSGSVVLGSGNELAEKAVIFSVPVPERGSSASGGKGSRGERRRSIHASRYLPTNVRERHLGGSPRVSWEKGRVSRLVSRIACLPSSRFRFRV